MPQIDCMWVRTLDRHHFLVIGGFRHADHSPTVHLSAKSRVRATSNPEDENFQHQLCFSESLLQNRCCRRQLVFSISQNHFWKDPRQSHLKPFFFRGRTRGLIQNPKSQNRKSIIQNPKSKIQNPKPKSKIKNQKSKIKNPKSKIQNQKSKIQNPKSKIKNQNPKSKSKIEFSSESLLQKATRFLNFSKPFLKGSSSITFETIFFWGSNPGSPLSANQRCRTDVPPMWVRTDIAITSRGPKKWPGHNKNLTFLSWGVNFRWYFWAGPMRSYPEKTCLVFKNPYSLVFRPHTWE